MNRGKLAVLKESCAIEAVYHNPSAPGLASDLEGIKQVFTMFRTTSPDIRLTIEDMIAEGNEMVSRLTMRGTHKDEPVSIPPTGKQAMVAAIDVHRISGGKLVENCGVFDELGMMQQLGIAPPPGQIGR